MKQLLIAVVLIAAGVAGAYFYLRTTTYYPVVRLAAPEGFTITAVQMPVATRELCDAANRRFSDPLKKSCNACKFEFERCAGSLTGDERALAGGDPLNDYSVSAVGIRMIIAGPASLAKPACEQLASDMVQKGVKTAACVYPGVKR